MLCNDGYNSYEFLQGITKVVILENGALFDKDQKSSEVLAREYEAIILEIVALQDNYLCSSENLASDCPKTITYI